MPKRSPPRSTAASDPAALFDALNRFRVLCATREGARGVDEINARVAAKVRERVGTALALGAQWFAGRPVIVTRNDYALGLFNGDIGIAMPARRWRVARRVPHGRRDAALRLARRAAAARHRVRADGPQVAGLGVRPRGARVAGDVQSRAVARTRLYGDHAGEEAHRRDRLAGDLCASGRDADAA